MIYFSNYGYLNHFHNFKCFMDRLGIKFLVIALDKRTDEYMNKLNVTSIFYTGKVKVEESYAEFRTKQFNIITNRKMDAVLRILELGYDVVFADIDVVVIRDPMPFFDLNASMARTLLLLGKILSIFLVSCIFVDG